MGNDTCDICGYQHSKPDMYGIVVECADGILRCKKCRSDPDYTAKRIVQAVAALPQDDQDREDAVAMLRNAGSLGGAL